MKFTLTDTSKVQQLTVVFKNLKLFAVDVVFRANNDKLHIQTLDNAQCCLLDAYICSDWFDSYDYEHDNEQLFGINTIALQKVMDVLDATQTLEIVLDPNQDNINISMKGSQTTCDKRFEVPLVDLEIDLMTPDDSEYDADIVMRSKQFTTLVKQLQGFSDTMATCLTNDTISLKSSGEGGSMVANVNIETDVVEYAITEDTEIKQSFGLKYIEYMYSFGGLSAEVNIHMNHNQPMQVRYNFSENDDNSYVAFYLAPKMD